MNKRFFFELVLVVLIAAALLPYLLNDWLADMALRSSRETLYRYHVSTPLELIAHRLNSVDAADRNDELNAFRTNFPYKVSLFRLEDLSLDEKSHLRLFQNKQIYDSAAHRFYRLLNDNTTIVAMGDPQNLSPRHLSPASIEVMGVATLLQQTLTGIPEQQWSDKIAEVNAHFRYPLSLVSLDDLPLPVEDMRDLRAGELLTTTASGPNYGSGVNQFYQRVGDSNYAVMGGPIAPYIQTQINHHRLRNFLLVALCLIIVLALWLWPTWRSARALNEGIQRLGNGDLGTRAKSLTGSHLNSVTDLFNNMVASLESVQQDNQTLLSGLGPQLTPPIHNLNQEIAELENSKSNSDLKQRTTRIQTLIDELNSQTSDTLLFTRLSSDQVQLNTQTLCVDTWLSEQHQALSSAEHKVSYPRCSADGIKFAIDPALCARLIQRLVSQAAKFTDLPITLSAAQSGEAAQIELCVSTNQPSSTLWSVLLLESLDKVMRLHTGSFALHESQTVVTVSLTFPSITTSEA